MNSCVPRPCEALSLVDTLDAWATRQPDALLFAFHDAQGAEVERYTYRQFARRTAGLARTLQSQGLRPGQRALLAHPPGLELIAALFACARIGVIGVVVPADGLGGQDGTRAGERVRAVARDCTAAALLTIAAQAAGLPALDGVDVLATDRSTGHAEPFCDGGQHVLLLQYTSGSTAQPKGVIVTHGNVIADARALLDHVPIGVTWLPQFHDMGLIGFYLFPVVMGGCTHGVRPVDFLRHPALWLRLLSDTRATYASAPNFGYEHCLAPGRIDDDVLHDVDLSSLRVMLNGAEPVRPEACRRFAARFARFGLAPGVLRAAYGLAEATLAVTAGGSVPRRFDAESLARGRAEPARPGPSRALELASCGLALDGIRLEIRDTDGGSALPEAQVGEICVGGATVTPGYWGRAPLRQPLRTGDLGFLLDGELYVCGRRSDTLIVRGRNLQPQDIEQAVDDARVRPRGVVACQDEAGEIVLVVELRDPRQLPDLADIARCVNAATGVLVDRVLAVPPRSIAVTTSGKLARAATRRLLDASQLPVLATHRPASPPADGAAADDAIRRLEALIADRPDGAGRTVAEAGFDSLGLVTLQLELQQRLRRAGLAAEADRLDGPSLQHWRCVDVVSVARALRDGDTAAVHAHAAALCGAAQQARRDESLAMQRDLDAMPARLRKAVAPASLADGDAVVLTGATGFFGPFLLDRLLELTTLPVIVLARGADDADARSRVLAALARVRHVDDAAAHAQRVVVWRSELAAPALGLDAPRWRDLAARRCAIVHNGAMVDYVRNYAALRPANVAGTRSILELAMTGEPKPLHHVSSTFVFGWTRKGVLLESDSNDEMSALDFGYSQSKWVAEQLVRRAAAAGLPVAVYRPSLISVSRALCGDTHDVAARLLAFMIRHGVAVDTPNQISLLPADVLAHNLIAIALAPGAGPDATFHLTADRYHSLTELTQQISRDFGYDFEYHPIGGFIRLLNAIATPADPVYPLLDFFNRSAPHIEAMSLKRYSNAQYRRAREASGIALPDPGLQEIARRLVFYLLELGWTDPPAAGRTTVDGRSATAWAAQANAAPAAASAR